MDVVLEIKMSTFKKNEHECPAFSGDAAAPMLIGRWIFFINDRSGTPYMKMMSSN